MTFTVGQHVIVQPSFNDEHYRYPGRLTEPFPTTVEQVTRDYFTVVGVPGKFGRQNGIQKIRRSASPRRVIPAEENH
jgi:hypothetical protein